MSDRLLAFKNNASFMKCISKINGVLIDNAEDLDVVIPMYNFLDYSKNYRKTTGSLWNYYRDEPNIYPDNNYNQNSITNSESFKYKTSITRKTSNENQENNENTEQENTKTKKIIEIVVPLKQLSNFWRTIEMLLINCEIELILTWSENCVLTDNTTHTARDADPDANPPAQARERIDASTNATFKITDTKLHVPIVTLSTKNDKKILEQLKSVFKRTVK